MKFMFFPKNYDFFRLFDAQADKLLEVGKIIAKFEKEAGNIEKYSRAVKKVEKEADNNTHDIIKTLNQTFITPFEREDIASLASHLDTIIDELERAYNRLSIYDIETIPITIFKYGDLIIKSLEEVARGVKLLKNGRKREEILKICEIINLIEHQADDLHRQCLAELFQKKEPIMIMKLREIYEALENVTDSCENAANAIESIIIKNA